MDFEARVWDCYGGDSEAVRGLHFGNGQGNSKKAEGGLKVLIFHHVPQSKVLSRFWGDRENFFIDRDGKVWHIWGINNPVSNPEGDKMKRALFLVLFVSASLTIPSLSPAKELTKIAVWDLTSGDIKGAYAQDLTLILCSEVSKLGKYEVYSQENVRTLAGWTAERMQLGCTDTKCLTALGQMDIAKLISGRVGKIGNRFSVSLSLFDTQNAKAEKMISEFCRSEDELIELVQVAVRKLLGEEIVSAAPSTPIKAKPRPSSVPPTWNDPVTGMEFVFIKGGCFEMGDTFGDGGKDEKPVHEACVDDFYLGKYEVTVGEFRKFVDATGYSTEAEKGDGCLTSAGEKWEMDRSASWRSPGFPINDKHPVVCVSWNDAVAYARWMEGRGGKTYRLPTEAQWEYAARSGGKREKYSGTSQEGELGQYAWYGDNSGRRTHPVGQKNPNGLGLYDMSGNVWEWCSDSYDENYYKISPKDNPHGPIVDPDWIPDVPDVELRTVRGGSWVDDPWFVRAANRFRDVPASWGSFNGFRLGASAR